MIKEILQPVYVQDMWMGKTAWFTTAYFVDPLVICNGGRCLFGFLNHICHLDILNLLSLISLSSWFIYSFIYKWQRWRTRRFRSSSDWDYYGTGDRLLIQNGATDNLISIPLTQEEADMTSDWWGCSWWDENCLINSHEFSKCWCFSGMITSASLAWETTTFSSTTPPTRCFSLII